MHVLHPPILLGTASTKPCLAYPLEIHVTEHISNLLSAYLNYIPEKGGLLDLDIISLKTDTEIRGTLISVIAHTLISVIVHTLAFRVSKGNSGVSSSFFFVFVIVPFCE